LKSKIPALVITLLHHEHDKQCGYPNCGKEVWGNTQEIANDCALTRIVGPDIIRNRLKAEEAHRKNTEPVVDGFGVV
jgi:hypothetical protein